MTITPQDLLGDAFTRIRDDVHGVVAGLSGDQLSWRPDGHGNSIAWLVWHLTRIQDDHVAGVAGVEQVWTSEGWAERFGLPFAVGSTGYGHSSDDVSAVNADADGLLGYHDAVHAYTARYLSELDGGDLDHVVDDRWDPPVTLAVRLVSVVGDDFQHVGQAGYVRGLLP
jgi:hypothetical protein